MTQQCTKCGKLLELNEFEKDSRYKLGYRKQCRKCRNLMSRTRAQRIPLEALEEKQRCPSCLELLELNGKNFERRNDCRSGFRQQCRKCRNLAHNKREHKNILKRRIKNKNYRNKYPERVKISKTNWNARNKEHISKINKEWRKKNIGHLNNYMRIKRQNDIRFKLQSNLYKKVNQALHFQDTKKEIRQDPLWGCSIMDLRRHLESLFKPRMTWENYGRYGWHIDHIRPCSSFDLTDPEQQYDCFNYKNLQPLWAKDNLRKGSKYATA